MNKPYNITSVCKADLLGMFTQKQIDKLDEDDMQTIASKMQSAYCDGQFWQDLKIISESIIYNKYQDDEDEK